MVRGHHDRQRGHDRIKQRQPAPARPERGDHGDGDEDGPANMHRRHGGELISLESAGGRVHRLAVTGRRVYHPDRRQHAGRGNRNQLDQQAQAGECDQSDPELGVPISVPDEQPDQARDQDREMQDVIVEVEYLHHQRMRQDQPLQGGLAREVKRALGVPEPACPASRPVRPHQRVRPGELPQGEQPEHHGCLPHETASGTQAPCCRCSPQVVGPQLVIGRPASLGHDPAAAQERSSRDGEACRACPGLLPGQV